MGKFRCLMIQSIKYAPYITMMCIALSYFELLYAYTFDMYIEYDGYYEYNLPLTENIFSICNYDWYPLLILFCASRALQFCMYHTIPIAYLAFNLVLKSYFNNILIEEYFVPYLISINILTITVIAISVALHIKQLRNDRRGNKTTSTE